MGNVSAYRRVGVCKASSTSSRPPGDYRLIPLACKEVEDENDDEDESDWGSGGRELRPNIAGIVCIKAIDSLKLHVNCMCIEDFYWMAFLFASASSLIVHVLVVVLVLGLW
jgi:hypothetical protein